MATHSSTLAWEIPWTEEPGRLQSMGSQRVGHDLATKQQQHLCMHAQLRHFVVWQKLTQHCLQKTLNTGCHQVGFQTRITSLMSSRAGRPPLRVSMQQQS